jgi:hypothetical protein
VDGSIPAAGGAGGDGDGGGEISPLSWMGDFFLELQPLEIAQTAVSDATSAEQLCLTPYFHSILVLCMSKTIGYFYMNFRV